MGVLWEELSGCFGKGKVVWGGKGSSPTPLPRYLGWGWTHWVLLESFPITHALQPFWPLGTGVARGFLAAFDAAWMVKRWAEGAKPLEVLAER